MFSDWHNIQERNVDFHHTIVAAAQRDWEIKELYHIFDKMQPNHILEIGSWYGATLYHWLTFALPGSIVCNIDNLNDCDVEPHKDIIERWKTWAGNGVTFNSHIGQSDDMAIYKAIYSEMDGVIDFLFIDGCHTYDVVKDDFERYGTLVRPGGIIALHDITMDKSFREPGKEAVMKLWREIQEAGYKTQELRIARNTCGIGVVYV
jgi:predicted O-methyltransferase YrrM